MKHAKLLSVFILLFLVTTSSQVLAARIYVPNTQRDMSANRAYCLGATASNIRFRYYTCSLGTGTNTGVSMTVYWYQNAVNSTTGGTLVSTATVTGAAASSGSLTYLPSIVTPGTYYYYCVVEWSGAGTCNTSGTLTSTTTRIIVSETPGPISGNDIVCIGTPATYTNIASGGTWTRSNSRLSIDPVSGVANGVSAGVVNITYTVACGTRFTKTVTVQAVPTVNAITGGNSVICLGSTATLNCSPTGGTWMSSNTAVATIGTDHVVTSVATGTSTITYTRALACGTATATKVVSVAETPGAIVGNNFVCIGTPTTYTNSSPGGTWSRSNTRLNIDVNSGAADGVSAGSVRITYRGTCGVRVTKTVTVQAVPTVNAITGGTTNICQGVTVNLNCSPSGGTWVSGNTAVAVMGTGRQVTGVSPGTSIITYTRALACGTASTTKVVTVSTVPSAISGDATTCESYTLTYTDAVPYGRWTSSNTARATVESATGVITALTAGTVRITYNTRCSPYVTKLLSINASPAAITGSRLICGAGTTSLATATPGGTWSSGNTAVATVDASGLVTAVSFGTAAISYTLASSCDAVAIVTVGATPATISGPSAICSDGSTVLTNSVAYGVWSSSNPAVATIEDDGTVTPVSQGTTTITYVTGCGADATHDLSVYTQPAAITGTASVCEAATTTLANATSGGVWSSENTSIATVNSSGVVTGVSEGGVDITYTNGVCYSTIEASVDPLPVPGNITGALSVCEGDGTALDADGDAGGAWTSGSASIATVNASGVVTGVLAGTANITYTVTNGCGTVRASVVTTVNADPVTDPISGASTVCQAATTALSNASAGGVWSSSNNSVATINSGGVVSGVAVGNATISYTVNNACGSSYAIQVMTVDPLADAGTITGTAVVCATATTALGNATAGGVWSSSNTSVATVGTDGVVTGIASGNATISYAVSSACGTAYATQVVTVNSAASAGTITGTPVVCATFTTDLDNATGGGIWSSSDAGIATVDASGIVTGVATGNATISYTVSNSCGTGYATQVVTVGVAPASITGSVSICLGGSTTLSIADAGGTWSSSNPSQATVNFSTGVVTAVSVGTSDITYTSASGCYSSTLQVTVSSTVPGITGTNHGCVGQSTALGNATSGGVWSSSNTAIATVDAVTGEVTGVDVGSTTISYTTAGGCFTPISFYVYAMPDPITGIDVMCTEGVTSMYSTSGGAGVWSSSDSTIASISPIIGTMTGISAGTTTLTYRISYSGCYVTKDVTVNQTPASIIGVTPICNGDTRVFTSATGGGVWTSYRPEVASVDASSGLVTAVSGGGSTITYTSPNGCYRTYTTTINALPAPIIASASTFNICLGASATLTSATTGGTWSSGNTSIAIVGSASGVAVSQNLGTTTISYTGPNGCSITSELTVYSALAATAGNDVVCKGYSTTLTNATSGGTWISSNTSIATINSITGVLSGLNGGTASISYRLGSGCLALRTMSVAAITGTTSMCLGGSTTLQHIVPGGTWSCSNTARATIDVSTGVVTSLTTGTAIVTYRVSPTIYNTTVIIVNALPASISGVSAFCADAVATFTPSGGSGRWYSSDTTVASINYILGQAVGRSAGTTTLSYVIPATGCYTTRQVTVMPTPGVICGASNVCTGLSTTLTSTPPDGVWTSSNTSVATVGSITGIVTGVAGGGTNIKYTSSNGCYRIKAFTVNAIPAAITGSTTVPQGGTTTLNSTTTGGTWSSANTAIATPATTTTITGGTATTGLVSGISAGSTTISYSNSFGCYRVANVTVVAAKPGAPVNATIGNDAEFRLYPNPTSGAFTIESAVNGVFAVYTFDGKLVGQYSISDRATSVSLPNNLAAGVYICQFRFEDGTTKTEKLFYQN